jgi:NADP-dependent aldehyde dehydrogenase
VLNFAASSRPFAFSVAGGDTTSALVVGYPFIVKAHSGHLRLPAQTAAIITTALEGLVHRLAESARSAVRMPA